MSDNKRRLRQPRGRSSHRSQNQNELDRFLESKNMWRKHIAKDGSCLFRAVAEQVYLSQVDHLQVRSECVEYIRQHQAYYKEFLEEPVDSYLFKLCHPTSWAGEIELAVLAEIYHRRIEVYHYHSNQVDLKSFGHSSPGEPSILLAYSDGNHYDSIMTKDFRNNSAICQSILYELLFKSVLQLPVPNRKDLQVHTRLQKDYSTDSNLRNFCQDDLMAFSSKVYFNAALGVHKTYREDLESQDWHLAMAMQFQEGDECQVWIDYRKEKKLFDGVIKAMNTSKGKHRVFIYDLNRTMEVKHQDFNVLCLVGGRRPSHIKNSDWLTQNKKKVTDKPPSSGRKDKGSQGKSASDKGHTKTYLTASHRKKRELVMANNLGSDEEDPEFQEQLRLIELQDKDSSFPALSSQATKAVSEPYDLVSTLLTHQQVTSSSTTVTIAAPVLTTTPSGSLPSSAVPKVKPIQKQHKFSTSTATAALVRPPVTSSQPQVVSSQPQVASSRSQVASSKSQVASSKSQVASSKSQVASSKLQVPSTKQQPKSNSHNTHFVSSNNLPLNSTEEFFLTKSVTTTVPATNAVAPKSTVTTKGNHLHNSSVQQHTDVAKQLMQVIHQERESQQSSERQLMTLSMPMSPTSSAEPHSSWPELLPQDEQRATPLNVQEQHSAALPTISSTDLSGAPASKSPYATQALPTANTVTHMPSTAVKVAKAPPSFFTTTKPPPSTGQATPTTKVAQTTAAAVRTSVTTSVVQPTLANKPVSMATGSQATPTNNKALSVSPIGSQGTPTGKGYSIPTASLATPTTSRAPPTFSVPTSAVKTSGFANATLAPPINIAAGAPSTVAGPHRVPSPTALNLEMPLVQLPKPPLQLFQDGENGLFYEQYGRMCFAILLQQCPGLAHVIHGFEAKLSGKTHSHDLDLSEEERRLIEEQSQRLETWKKSPNILHTMKELQGQPAQSEVHTVNITKSAGLPLGQTVPPQQPLQDGTRKLQIVFPSLKEPEEDTAAKDFQAQGKENYFKNLNKEELEMLQSLMKKLDLHQLQTDTAVTTTGGGGGVSSDETISAQTTSSLPPSDTELSTASEPTAQLGSPVQTVPQPHPSQSAESSSPDMEPSLRPTVEGPVQEDKMMDTDPTATAEKPDQDNNVDHQHENLDSEGAAFTSGMIPPHNAMAAMATMGPFIPSAAAAGFMPTMLPAPINPYMMAPQAMYYYHQMLQHAHYSQMLQQSMAAAAINSPTMLPGNQEDGHFAFQQKNIDTMNAASQDVHNHDVDPVEVTVNTNHPNDEQLRGNSPLQSQANFTSDQGDFSTSTIPSVNMHLDPTLAGINMAPSFTGTAPILSSPLQSSSEGSGNSQLQFGTEEQIANRDKDLLKVLPPKVSAPSNTELVSTNNKKNHSPRREYSPRREPPKKHYANHCDFSGVSNRINNWKQPQSTNKQSNSNNYNKQKQSQHHNKYGGDIIDHELSQIGLHNSFPDGIPSMEFSSDKRRKAQQT